MTESMSIFQVARRRPPELLLLELQVVVRADTGAFNFGAKAALKAGKVVASRHMSSLAVKAAALAAEILVVEVGVGTGVVVGVGVGTGVEVPLVTLEPLT